MALGGAHSGSPQLGIYAVAYSCVGIVRVSVLIEHLNGSSVGNCETLIVSAIPIGLSLV